MDSLKKTDSILCFFLGLSIFYGIVSFEHYSPSSSDFYINIKVFFISCIGLSIFFYKRNLNIYTINLFWIFIFLIFLIQPFLNKLTYVDGLIFPLSELILIFFISIAIKNIKFKRKFITNFSIAILLTSLILLITQFFHILKINLFVDFFKIPLQSVRFSGNIFQPNQAAFVFCLGCISALYNLKNLKNNKIIYILIYFLSIGVYFTGSRAGFILLILSTLVYNIIINKFEKINLFKIYGFFSTVLGGLSGYFFYSIILSGSENLKNRLSESFGDPRLSLLKQSFLIIKDHPINGVGWKNFASTTVEYYNQLEVVGLIDNSHFIVTQLLAEFGLFGFFIILFYFILFVKGFKSINKYSDFYILIIIISILFYSCFEFPLWYLRFFIIFSVFSTFFDKSEKVIFQIKSNVSISIFIVILSFFSVYYGYQYKKISYQYSYLLNKNNKSIHVNNVFGFTYFNDLLLFQSMSLDNFMIDSKLVLAERVTKYVPSSSFLNKTGSLYLLNGDKDKALYYFKISCHYSVGKDCNKIDLRDYVLDGMVEKVGN